MHGGHFAEVAAECAHSNSVERANAGTCILAACKSGDAAKARQWLPTAPESKHDSVVAACEAMGITLDTKPSKKVEERKPDHADDCKRDPLACQH